MFAFLNKKITQLLLLLLLFSLSVFIRFPDLSSDLNRESEWQTGHVLTTLSIWENDGLSAHYFSPVWTFNTPADKFTNSLGGIKDKNNFTYYTSYPPFSFILPYAVLKLCGVKVSVSAIRIFSLLIHLPCSLLVFLLVNLLWKNFIPSLLAFCVYLFSAGNLWFHGNFYFADSLVQLFVLGTLLVFVVIVKSPEKNLRTKNSLLVLLTFFGIYTEWLALFVAIFVLLFLVWKLKTTKLYLRYVIGIICGISLSLSLIIVQYSSIAGFTELKQHSLNKYSSRSGFIEQTALDGLSITEKNSFSEIYHNYIRHYNYPGLLVLLGMAFLIWRRFKNSSNTDWNTIAQYTLWILVLSVITHHLLFFNFTAIHDVSTLKTSLLFCLFLGYVSSIFNFIFSEQKSYLNSIIVLGLIVFIVFSANRYHQVNAGGNDIYHQEKVGKLIAEFSSPDEVVFTNIGVSPVMMWYAQRNPVTVKNEEEGRLLLQSMYPNKALFLKINPKDSTRFYELIRLSAEQKPKP